MLRHANKIASDYYSYPTNPTNISNVKVCEDGCLFHIHAKITERIKMKLLAYTSE